MGLGKMNTLIEIIAPDPVKDSEGFTTAGDTILASVRAYMEQRHGSAKWSNMAAFSTATVLFRFRKIPGVEVTTSHAIVCAAGKFRILSVEDIKRRGMYIEVLSEKYDASVR